MQFELTEALLNQVLFSMEEQDIDHLLDSRRGVVVDADSIEESGEEEETGRFFPIPEWRSADGFRLMEGFAASLRNPIVREELTAALDRGRGVFRAFKDVLSGRPEVERLWFAWKEREMRRAVTDWYDALREEWGLERLGEEPDETGDLLLEDFRFRAAEAAAGAGAEPAAGAGDEAGARRLHELCLAEVFGVTDSGWRKPRSEELDPLRADPWPLAGVPGRVALVAETARGDFAAFALAIGPAPLFKLVALEVAPEYRGLGVGEDLLARMLGACRSLGGRSLVLDLPASSEAFARVLAREGFAPFETRYRIDLDSP